jgi:hypothetical protein
MNGVLWSRAVSINATSTSSAPGVATQPENFCLKYDLADDLNAVKNRVLNLTEIVICETELF